MPCQFLLISEQPGLVWLNTLDKALHPIGDLETLSVKEALLKVSERSYDLVILDTRDMDDPGEWVTRLREKNPGLRIMVVTGSPTWRRARQAMQAGAVDYISKSLDREYLRTRVEAALQVHV